MLPLLRPGALACVFLTAYVGSAVFVLHFLTENGIVAVFWPPAGFAVTAVLLGGRRYLLLIFIGAFAANQLSGAASPAAAVLALINTFEAGFAAYLLRSRKNFDPTLERARDFFKLILYGGIGASLFAALAGATTLEVASLTRQSFWSNLQFWWMGDSLGIIGVAPLLLIWRRLPKNGYSPRQWFEAFLAFAVAVFFGQVVLAGWDIGGLAHYSRGFVLFIFVTWAAVRFGRHATALIVTIFMLQIMLGLVKGSGYFAAPDTRIVFGNIWVYSIVMSVTGMALATYIYEARSLMARLELASERLEQVGSIAGVGGWEYDVRRGELYCSRQTLQILGFPENGRPGIDEMIALVTPEEREINRARAQLAVEQGIGWDTEFTMRTRSGAKLWVRSQAKPMWENGRITRLVGALHDLTEKHASEIALQRSELEFKRLVETSSEGIWTIDENGSTTFVNQRMADMLGYVPEEMMGTYFASYVTSELKQRSLEKLERRKSGVSEVEESALLHKSGRTVWTIASTSPIRDHSGKITGALAMITDISERRNIEEQLRRSEARYRELVEASADAIIVHQSGFIVYVNGPAIRLVRGSTERDLIGRNALEFVAPEYRAVVLERLKEVNRPEGRVPLMEEKFLRLDGTTVDVEVSATATVYNDKPATMVVVRDITERKRAEAEIRYLGQHDTLTGLPNRALFADRLTQTIALAQRHQSVFALIFLDLDHFKKINDSYGHQYGDAFLKQVARLISASVRGIDTVSRQGGDEFIVLLSDLAHPEDAAGIARNICEELAKPIEVSGVNLQASVSAGIAVFPRDGDSAEILMRNADIAMYHAKSRGRNQYQFFSEELNRTTQQRLEIELALRQAIAANQLRLVYQPQMNLQTGAIEGFEALLRWNHPGRGAISPVEFIPVAEESGQIIELGEWVLATALRQIPGFDKAGFGQLRIAVNVSALQLRKPEFADRVLELLHVTGVQAGRLELEVTESMLMSDTEVASHVIRRLTAAGVHFAIDDFGTGYSSLSYLKQLKLNHLKIDRSFISDLTHDPDDASIARTIIALAQNLRLKAVAEGVETAEQRDFLRTHGCEMMQGFLLAAPLEFDEALRFLSSHHR